MTDIPLPSPGDTDWNDWAAEQEELSDAARGGAPSHVPATGLAFAPPRYGGTLGVQPAQAGQLYGCPIFLPAGTVSRLLCPSAPGGTAVAGTIRFGLYALNRTNPALSTRLVDTGDIDASNGNAALVGTINLAVDAGWYLLAQMNNQTRPRRVTENGHGMGATAYVSAGSNLDGFTGWLGASGLAGLPLPATFGGSLGTTNLFPLVYVEMAS